MSGAQLKANYSPTSDDFGVLGAFSLVSGVLGGRIGLGNERSLLLELLVFIPSGGSNKLLSDGILLK